MYIMIGYLVLTTLGKGGTDEEPARGGGAAPAGGRAPA